MRLRPLLLVPLFILIPALAGWGAPLFAQTVFTGTDPAHDQLISPSTTDLSANWFGFTAVTGFTWWIGSSPGAQDVHPPVNVALATTASATGLSLSVGSTYYITVQGALAAGGNQTVTSAGVLIIPAASATPVAGTVPLTVAFSGPAAPGVVLYEWQFSTGDGSFTRADVSSQTDGNAAFTYTQSGLFFAVFRMTHQNGFLLSQSLAITANPSPNPPSTSIQASAVLGNAPFTVNFTQSARTFDGTVIAYLWDWNGDGTVDQSTTVPTASHTFTAAGNYTVIASAVDAAGAISTASVLVTVNQLAAPAPPSVTLTSNFAQFSAPPGNGQLITFTAMPTPGTGTIQTYSWDFTGSGELDLVTTVPTATWRYDDPGSYTPTVTVLDSNSLSAQGSTAFVMGLNLTNPRCWITEPPAASPPLAVAGTFVTVLAQTVPMGQTLKVDFFYSPSGANAWVLIGTSLPSGSEVFGTHWDTTVVAQGALYDLRAVASFVGGGTGDSTILQTVTVLVDQTVNDAAHAPFDQEFHGSPFTSLKLTWISPLQTTQVGITRDMEQALLAGSVLSYDQMRTERRGDNPFPLEGRLQGLRFVPGHYRRTSFSGGSALQKPSKITMYLNQDLSSILADGTDVSKSTVALYRFEPSRSRWEPLLGNVKITSKALIKASMVATGDLGVVVLSSRPLDDSPTGSGGGTSHPCGLVGLEAIPLALLYLWRMRKR